MLALKHNQDVTEEEIHLESAPPLGRYRSIWGFVSACTTKKKGKKNKRNWRRISSTVDYWSKTHLKIHNGPPEEEEPEVSLRPSALLHLEEFHIRGNLKAVTHHSAAKIDTWEVKYKLAMTREIFNCSFDFAILTFLWSKLMEVTHCLLKCLEKARGEAVQCCASPLGALCHNDWSRQFTHPHCYLFIYLFNYTCC